MKPKIYTIYIYSRNKAPLVHFVETTQKNGYRCQLQHCSATGEYRMALVVIAYTKIGALLAAKMIEWSIEITERVGTLLDSKC